MQSEGWNRVINLYSENRKIYSATIELCYSCNWNCKFCYLENHDDCGLSSDIIRKMLIQLRELGCFDLTFTGGEIFTRTDTYEIIRYARELGFAVTLMTNLSLIDEQTLDNLKAVGIEKIESSLFSLNPLVHDDFVRSKGAFNKVYYNLFYCQKIGIKVRVGFIPLNFNQDELDYFIKFTKQYGLETKYDCRVLPRMNHDMAGLKYALLNDDLVEALGKIDKEMGVEYSPKNEGYLCENTHTNIVITPKGDVRLCAVLDIAIGNVLQESIDEILNSDKNEKIILQIRDTKWSDLKQECKECADNKYCVRCPGIVLLENKDFFGCSPINCRYAKARRKVDEQNEKNIMETKMAVYF